MEVKSQQMSLTLILNTTSTTTKEVKCSPNVLPFHQNHESREETTPNKKTMSLKDKMRASANTSTKVSTTRKTTRTKYLVLRRGSTGSTPT